MSTEELVKELERVLDQKYSIAVALIWLKSVNLLQ